MLEAEYSGLLRPPNIGVGADVRGPLMLQLPSISDGTTSWPDLVRPDVPVFIICLQLVLVSDKQTTGLRMVF